MGPPSVLRLWWRAYTKSGSNCQGIMLGSGKFPAVRQHPVQEVHGMAPAQGAYRFLDAVGEELLRDPIRPNPIEDVIRVDARPVALPSQGQDQGHPEIEDRPGPAASSRVHPLSAVAVVGIQPVAQAPSPRD